VRNKSPPVARGRPTREAALLRHRELLDRAMEMFLDRGFETTTIRDIAASIGMTRRSVYARYSDKQELFRATLENGADRIIVSAEALDAVDTSDLEGALLGFIRLRLDVMLTPLGVQMQRFVYAEASRFPDLVREVYARISQPTTDRIDALLQRSNAEGKTAIEDTTWAARALMSMAIGSPITMALIAGLARAEDIESHIRRSVDLFLHGYAV